MDSVHMELSFSNNNNLIGDDIIISLIYNPNTPESLYYLFILKKDNPYTKRDRYYKEIKPDDIFVKVLGLKDFDSSLWVEGMLKIYNILENLDDEGEKSFMANARSMAMKYAFFPALKGKNLPVIRNFFFHPAVWSDDSIVVHIGEEDIYYKYRNYYLNSEQTDHKIEHKQTQTQTQT